MSCSFWNCQGLGSPLTVLSLGSLIRKSRPAVIFLSETRGSSQYIESLKRKFNLHGIGVDSQGLSGGLALLWDRRITVELGSFSKNHIDARVKLTEDGHSFRVTGIYGVPEVSHRHQTWNLIRDLYRNERQPWFMGGDFNEILMSTEKSGGDERSTGQMEAFSAALADVGLADLGFEGYPYTWSNNRRAPRTVRCRLDRVCADAAAIERFPNNYVEHIEHPGSDHLPILLHLDRQTLTREAPRKRPFRFESVWARKNECSEIVCSVWEGNNGGTPAVQMIFKGEECSARLVQWCKATNPARQIEKVRKKLMEIRGGVQSETARSEILKLTAELETLLRDQEMYWQQRGKAEWLKAGDKNTSFFHAKASIREQVNKIDGLRDETGVWRTNKRQLEGMVDGYFRNLFRSTNPGEREIEEVLQSIDSRLSEETRLGLSQPFTAQEVKDALSSMSPLKSPGPDGYPALFFIKNTGIYWVLM